MPVLSSLPLSDIIDVEVFISPQAPPLPQFNQGLILGVSDVIEPWGDGLLSLKINNGGSGYTVGDIINVVQGSETSGQVEVTAVDDPSTGVVTGVKIYESGQGYFIAAALTTSYSGAGVGLTIDLWNVGTNNARARFYSNLNTILGDGFQLNDPEYIAASLYFGQTPSPQYLWIGCQNILPDAIQAVVITTHTASKGELRCGSSPDTTINDWKAFTGGSAGALDILVDGDAVTLSGMDFSGVAAMGDVAGIIQTALAAVKTGATVTWDGTRFHIFSGTTGSSSSVGPSTTAGAHDIGSDMAATVADGALSIQGVNSGPDGTGYQVGDYIGVVGGFGGLLRVARIGVGGTVTALNIIQDGNGYTTANGVMTVTSGPGVGLEVNITCGPETQVEAAQQCRQASYDWYGLFYCGQTVDGATKADHLALAAWVQSVKPVAMYFYTTSDHDVLVGDAYNIFAQLKALDYNRAFGFYSTSQGNQFPNNKYSACAAMGVAFGLNTGLANSFFTMMFKLIAGITPEPLSDEDVNTIGGLPGQGTGNNGNIYVRYAGGAYTIIQQGVLANGQYFDEVLNLDMMSADIQYSIMDLLVANPSIPQTDPGEAMLIHAVNSAADRNVTRGFLAPTEEWKGQVILNLMPGMPMPKGYLAQAQPYRLQQENDRQARKAMPIYLAICEAGAVHFVLVAVYVQR